MSWRDRALCATTPDFDPEDTLTAAPVCAACPVRAECLADAMATETNGPSYRYGIRGGKTAVQRAAMRGSDQPACWDCGGDVEERGCRRCADCRERRRTDAARRFEIEDARWGEGALRVAHAAYQRGERDALTREGERVYQRKRKRRQSHESRAA